MNSAVILPENGSSLWPATATATTGTEYSVRDRSLGAGKRLFGRDQRQETHAPRRDTERRSGRRLRHLRPRPRRLTCTAKRRSDCPQFDRISLVAWLSSHAAAASERAPLVRRAFQHFATGDHCIRNDRRSWSRCQRRCRCENATPEPDLRYCSKAIARRSSRTPRRHRQSRALPSAVCDTGPELCGSSRPARFDVRPV